VFELDGPGRARPGPGRTRRAAGNRPVAFTTFSLPLR